MPIIHKTFKYRVCPSEETGQILTNWAHTMRFVHNLCNEQRIAGLARSKEEKVYCTAFSQGLELTLLRQEHDWIRDVPRHVLVTVLDNLDEGWKRCFSRISGKPAWKKKSDQLSFTEFDHAAWHIKGNKLKFPKLAPMKIILHRPLEGKPKSCTLKRDGDQWYATIVCEVEIPDPVPRTEPRIDLDRGLTNFIGTSDRELIPNPKFLEKDLAKLAQGTKDCIPQSQGIQEQRESKE